MTKKRIISYDIMRIIAALMVVIIHSHTDLNVHKPDSLSFALINLLESIARIAVPVFIMITGALLLNENRESKFMQKYLSLGRSPFWGHLRLHL